MRLKIMTASFVCVVLLKHSPHRNKIADDGT